VSPIPQCSLLMSRGRWLSLFMSWRQDPELKDLWTPFCIYPSNPAITPCPGPVKLNVLRYNVSYHQFWHYRLICALVSE
jgi:hypothetical protein